MSDDQIVSIINRVQRLHEEKRTIEDDIKEVYNEARSNGYDVKVLRAVVKHLGKDENEVAEFDAIFDLYLQAVKRAASPAPRATHAIATAVPTPPVELERPLRSLAEANAIAAKDAQPAASPAPATTTADIAIPAFLRRDKPGNHPSFGGAA